MISAASSSSEETEQSAPACQSASHSTTCSPICHTCTALRKSSLSVIKWQPCARTPCWITVTFVYMCHDLRSRMSASPATRSNPPMIFDVESSMRWGSESILNSEENPRTKSVP